MLTARIGLVALMAGLMGSMTNLAPALADGPSSGAGRGASSRAAIWDGFYLGAHGGYGRLSGDVTTADNLRGSFDISGGVFGVHGGYRWGFGTLVVGVEVDISGTGIERTTSASSGGISASATTALDYLASARLVGGVNLGPVLLYATAGFGHAGASVKVKAQGYGQTLAMEQEASFKGAVLGAGVEGRATDKITIRAEVLHYVFDRTQIASDAAVDLSATVLRTGVSLRLN